VKRLSADDSADSRVKVGHRQATYPPQSPCFAGALVSPRGERTSWLPLTRWGLCCEAPGKHAERVAITKIAAMQKSLPRCLTTQQKTSDNLASVLTTRQQRSLKINSR
jgi:hypothetical protein